ncbi:MAM and LDL-receptor class A domain-containing protein 1-like [Tribolium madens]|uniref:MAM and LDL-receptor class A domain-containing protein 1-like n=1 Tax=Tribolium madens TaxID=41895 RepID=UPI001CF7316F|nr:MAM and LDL-receptor class A domain-containing protein 1-like [Tribolium madens]
MRGTCRTAKPPVNGFIYPSHGGAVLNFFCKSHFQLRGSSIAYCDGLHWDNPLPVCLATNSSPALSCDFEWEDLCGWNHDLNHDFDWTRLNYATPSASIGTGPSHDHTKGAGKDGFYMYIESSARNINDTARLISPVYDKTDENVCFEFYYHMYGSTTGSLRIYLKKVNETWQLDPKKSLWEKSGNQGNRWYRGFITIGSINTDYQIVIEGVRGRSYVSDIAIDDVRVIHNCSPDDEIETETTTAEPSTWTPISVESCENRCNTNDTHFSDWLITCDCDEGCFERNRCCPDYFDFCLSDTPTSVTSETSEITTVTVTSTSTTTSATTKTVTETFPPMKESEIITDYEDSDKSYDHQKIVIDNKIVTSDMKSIVFGVGVVFGVLFGVVGMAFVARRYQLCHCRRLKQTSNGDSQSDVRFLTSDEVIDFSLASDYDTL